MAKLVEELVVIKLSKMVKDGASDDCLLYTSDAADE